MQANYKSILKLAFPIIVGSAIQTSISVTDTAFMGHVGVTELAAISVISVYYLILFMIGFSYTKGTQILIARRLGENKLKDVGGVFDHSLVIILALAALLALIVHFGARPSLEALLDDKLVIKASMEYIITRKWGLLFSFTGSVFLAFYMAINRPKYLLIGIISMTTINIGLNYALIFGHFGFPKMGIKGAALASNLAEVFAAAFFLIHVFWSGWYKKYGMFKIKSLQWQQISNITKLSLPIVVQTLVGLLAWFIFFTYVEKMGTEALAISGIVKQVYMFVGIVTWALSSTANTVVSSLMGQGKSSLVLLALKRITILSIAMNAVIAVLLALFPIQVMSIFSPDLALLEKCVPVLYVTIVALMVYSVSTILYYGIVSTGSTNVSLIIEVVVILFYLMFIQFLYSIEGITIAQFWTSEIFYWLILAISCYVYLRSGHWKKIEI